MKNLIIGLAVGILIGIGIGYLIWKKDKDIPIPINTSTKGSPDSKMSGLKDSINFRALLYSLRQAGNKISDTSSVDDNAQFGRNIVEAGEIIQELHAFKQALNRKDSEEIPHSVAVTRRAEFRNRFPNIDAILPTYFEIETKDIRKLLLHNPLNIRFYPVLEVRPDKHTFTWAFIGANNVGDNIPDTVIDVINPCPPPPQGCKEL